MDRLTKVLIEEIERLQNELKEAHLLNDRLETHIPEKFNIVLGDFITYETVVVYEDVADEMEETTKTIYFLRAPKPNSHDGKHHEQIRDYFYRTPCGHDYDCCGCWYGGVRSIEEVKEGYVVTTSVSRNY